MFKGPGFFEWLFGPSEPPPVPEPPPEPEWHQEELGGISKPVWRKKRQYQVPPPQILTPEDDWRLPQLKDANPK